MWKLAAEKWAPSLGPISLLAPKQDVSASEAKRAVTEGYPEKPLWDFKPWKFILDSGGIRLSSVQENMVIGKTKAGQLSLSGQISTMAAD
jgi:hypothetical protein